MDARELLQEWKERCNRLPRTAEEEDYQTILRALSLLAAAEANDGTTRAERERADRNERDAERWRYWRVRPTHWNWFSARSIHTWKTPAQLDADTDAAIDAARGKK